MRLASGAGVSKGVVALGEKGMGWKAPDEIKNQVDSPGSSCASMAGWGCSAGSISSLSLVGLTPILALRRYKLRDNSIVALDPCQCRYANELDQAPGHSALTTSGLRKKPRGRNFGISGHFSAQNWLRLKVVTGGLLDPWAEVNAAEEDRDSRWKAANERERSRREQDSLTMRIEVSWRLRGTPYLQSKVLGKHLNE
ncbi:hypothetical protein B0H17DRAFT_1139113 [Mycena rosella]|uniref:Uncharacterized protein n=1 Tax=Mycena rosella TaxID=1033263 RepID=A0AAD7G8W2_MYCRO|nr:hypothetical protein B0H17DRAFT_1139113 [Mycena rosella]